MKHRKIKHDQDVIQTTLIYDEGDKLELSANFTFKSSKVLSLDVWISKQNTQNHQKIHSVYFCENFLGNKKVHHLLVNMVKHNPTSTEPIPPITPVSNTNNDRIKIKSKDLILTTILKHGTDEIVVEECYDPFGSHSNPESKNGDIIVGNP